MRASVFFLDANIFMYAAGAEHVYKEPCVQVLAAVETGQLEAVIDLSADKHFDTLSAITRVDPLDYPAQLEVRK